MKLHQTRGKQHACVAENLHTEGIDTAVSDHADTTRPFYTVGTG
jgi:hypothetical protein